MRAAALCAVLASGIAFAEQPLAAYPGAPSTRIGSDLVIGGEPYRIAYFLTRDPLPKVASHFKKTWAEAGYPVTTSGDFDDEGVVSAFFTRQGLVRSIVLRRHGDQTLGFSVLKDTWVRVFARGAEPLPRLEGALYASDLVARGEEGHTQHRSAVLEQPVQAARDARDAAWLKAGWERTRETQVKRTDDGKPQRVLEYQRRGEQAIVTLVEVDAKTSAIDETWVGPK
ncbi:MAG: hypothetical protein JNK82_37355 [Myxococcaceae bacterium]|nr:hypothetical protein [Myxococcaceae bacterium]